MKPTYEADRLDGKINESLQHDARIINALTSLEAVTKSLVPAIYPPKPLLAPQGSTPS